MFLPKKCVVARPASTCSPTRPAEEVTSLLSHLGIQLSLQEVEGQEGGWSTRENTVSVST